MSCSRIPLVCARLTSDTNCNTTRVVITHGYFGDFHRLARLKVYEQTLLLKPSDIVQRRIAENCKSLIFNIQHILDSPPVVVFQSPIE